MERIGELLTERQELRQQIRDLQNRIFTLEGENATLRIYYKDWYSTAKPNAPF